jgi:hypothetical protein
MSGEFMKLSCRRSIRSRRSLSAASHWIGLYLACHSFFFSERKSVKTEMSRRLPYVPAPASLWCVGSLEGYNKGEFGVYGLRTTYGISLASPSHGRVIESHSSKGFSIRSKAWTLFTVQKKSSMDRSTALGVACCIN